MAFGVSGRRVSSFLAVFSATLLAFSPAGACPGDCGDNGAVTVDELVRGVNIALGLQAVSSCPPADTDGDGTVTVAELVQAVNASIFGCPPGPPTPTATDTATETPTPSPSTTPTATSSATRTRTRSRTPTPTVTPLVSVCGGGPLTTTPQICSLVVDPDPTVSLGTVTLEFLLADLDGGVTTLCYGIAAPPNIPDPNRCRPFSVGDVPMNGPASYALTLPGLGRGTYAIAIVVSDVTAHRSNTATANFGVV
jgi:hypothetical protein